MRRLSGMDSVFLAAEGPANYLTHSMAVMVLDPSTMRAGDGVETVRDYVRERIHLVSPLRRRVVQVPLGLDAPRWIDDPSVDLDHHIRAARCRRPSRQRPWHRSSLSSPDASSIGAIPCGRCTWSKGSKGTGCASWRNCTTP